MSYSLPDIIDKTSKGVLLIAAVFGVMLGVFNEIKMREVNTIKIETLEAEIKELKLAVVAIEDISGSIKNLEDMIVTLSTEPSYQIYKDSISGATTSEQIYKLFMTKYLVHETYGGRRGSTSTLCEHAPDRMGFPLSKNHRDQICYELKYYTVIGHKAYNNERNKDQ